MAAQRAEHGRTVGRRRSERQEQRLRKCRLWEHRFGSTGANVSVCASADASNGNGDEGEWSPSTRAVHGSRDPTDACGGFGYSDTLSPPVVQTATYTFRDTEQLVQYQEGVHPSYEYGRYGNYTTSAAERAICSLEHAEDCLVSSSGMNTATTMLLALCQPGSHLVTTTDCYRRTRQFIQTMMPKMGVSYDVVHPSDYDALAEAINEKTAIFFTESPTNPYLRCVDIERARAVCDQASHNNCAVVIDSTFATPVNQLPLQHGAHLVVHSASKYLAGHHDVIAGAIAGSHFLVQEVRNLHAVLGGVADPHAAWLLVRGMKTLQLRVQQANASAQRIAETLSAHPFIIRVHYPGLSTHPDRDVALKQMSAFGGVLSFEVDGDVWDAAAVVDSVKLPYIAPSLGGTESLIEQPAVISYWDQGEEGRARLGIRDNLIRLSLGVEDTEDLERDLLDALESAIEYKHRRGSVSGTGSAGMTSGTASAAAASATTTPTATAAAAAAVTAETDNRGAASASPLNEYVKANSNGTSSAASAALSTYDGPGDEAMDARNTRVGARRRPRARRGRRSQSSGQRHA